MSKELVFKDYLPANSRILVDYRKPPKDMVTFAYPETMTYSQALWKFGLHTFSLAVHTAFYILIALAALGYGMYLVGWWTVKLVQNPSTFYTLLTSAPKPILTTLTPQQAIYLGIPLAIAYVIYAAGPLILTWYYGMNKEKLSKIIPKLNYQLHLIWHLGARNYVVFTPKDLTDNWVAIPEFSNIYLNYEAKGDMAAKLEKVEVLEYPFNFQTKYGSGRLSKKKVNIHIFRGRFVFSSKPTSGKIEVEFV